MQTEQGVLRASIMVTLLISAFGITFGILSGSFSIAFDGIYALVDASMSVLALIVANLIASYTSSRAAAGPLKARFSTGFWHLEPIVLGLNGVLLVAVSVYALVNAIGSLLMGGHALEFDFAIIYAVVTLIACTVMAVLETKANRTIRSDFVGLDAKAWMMSGGITAALLVAFCGGYLVQGTKLEWISPYIDPAVLALVCAVIIPLPVSNIRQALTDILLVAPDDLTAHVHEVAKGVLKEYGFLSYRAYIAKVGRAKQVELYFIVPTGLPPRRVEEWDAVRDRIGDAIGYESPDRWLTIAFTADPAWAD
ncbi:cation transporter [Xanthobacter autotrophicus]|uniref:cation diffusion facilitator family transporter n=1 Tax=Xanthobacter autotrophicus TaxID=280 RepID=UPI0037280455